MMFFLTSITKLIRDNLKFLSLYSVEGQKLLFVDLKKCTFTYFAIADCNIIPIILGY